ncbi:hypothetical protein V8F33_004975 [Rhypophila sp. PSN 637]
MPGPFAVCRTADIPAEVIDRFLATTYAYAEHLAAGLGPQLTVLGDSNNVEAALSTPTDAGTAANLTPSSFIGTTPAAVAEQLSSPANRFFIIMDKQSAEDDTVVLAHTTDDGQVETVRATFSSAQIVTTALDVGSQGFEEIQVIATDSADGVYGPERDEAETQRERGGPAPRKVLGAE